MFTKLTQQAVLRFVIYPSNCHNDMCPIMQNLPSKQFICAFLSFKNQYGVNKNFAWRIPHFTIPQFDNMGGQDQRRPGFSVDQNHAL